jgi:hypothetical protein
MKGRLSPLHAMALLKRQKRRKRKQLLVAQAVLRRSIAQRHEGLKPAHPRAEEETRGDA